MSFKNAQQVCRAHTHLQVSVWCDLLPDQLWQAPGLLLPVRVGGCCRHHRRSEYQDSNLRLAFTALAPSRSGRYSEVGDGSWTG